VMGLPCRAKRSRGARPQKFASGTRVASHCADVPDHQYVQGRGEAASRIAANAGKPRIIHPWMAKAPGADELAGALPGFPRVLLLISPFVDLRKPPCGKREIEARKSGKRVPESGKISVRHDGCHARGIRPESGIRRNAGGPAPAARPVAIPVVRQLRGPSSGQRRYGHLAPSTAGDAAPAAGSACRPIRAGTQHDFGCRSDRPGAVHG